MKYLSELKKEDVYGKTVLLRASLNVPSRDNLILDDTRIRASVDSIRLLKRNGARVVVVAHVGGDGSMSLRPVVERLNDFIRVGFTDVPLTEAQSIISEMKNGTVLVLENIRQYDGEKKASVSFSKQLASLADMYVNDAFSVSHRTHASIVGVPSHLPSYAGLLFEQEYKNLSKALTPKHPFVLIMGGVKVTTKLPLLLSYKEKADAVFVGGILLNTILKSAGYEVGLSLVDNDALPLLKQHTVQHITFPDFVIIRTPEGKKRTRNIRDIQADDCIVDVAPRSIRAFFDAQRNTKMIVWNGPMGNYEAGYGIGTKTLISELANSGAYTIVGGGDSSVLIKKMRKRKMFNFISTAGGAMLDFLSDGSLPGIDALG